MRSIILEGTKRALEYSAFCGAGRFLFISSGAVYGVQPSEVEHLTEEFPCQPVTEYGKAKLEAEKLCAQSGQNVVIARCFSFIGRYLPRDLHYAAGNFLGACEQNRPILIRGDGRTVRSYMEADDLVESLFTLGGSHFDSGSCPEAPGEVRERQRDPDSGRSCRPCFPLCSRCKASAGDPQGRRAQRARHLHGFSGAGCRKNI